jgi:hypothetical protein
MTRLTRRALLAAGAGVVVVAGAGVTWVATGSVEGAIATTLRRLLGDVHIAEAELARFTSAYLEVLAERGVGTSTVRAFGAADALVGNSWLRGLMPAAVGSRLERYERHLVSHFTLGTTFFEVADPHHDEVVFAGFAPVCANPFARFD